MLNTLENYQLITIWDLVQEIRKSVKSGSQLSALALTFALVAECSEIKYPDEWFENNAEKNEYLHQNFPNHYKKNGKYDCHSHDKERFQMWIDDWGNGRCITDRQSLNGLMPHLNGELLYQMRNALFHNGSNDIDFTNKKKITDIGNQSIVNFIFLFDEPTILMGGHLYSKCSDGQAEMIINVSGLINELLYYIELYYKKESKKKVFNNIKAQIENYNFNSE